MVDKLAWGMTGRAHCQRQVAFFIVTCDSSKKKRNKKKTTTKTWTLSLHEIHINGFLIIDICISSTEHVWGNLEFEDSSYLKSGCNFIFYCHLRLICMKFIFLSWCHDKWCHDKSFSRIFVTRLTGTIEFGIVCWSIRLTVCQSVQFVSKYKRGGAYSLFLGRVYEKIQYDYLGRGH